MRVWVRPCHGHSLSFVLHSAILKPHLQISFIQHSSQISFYYFCSALIYVHSLLQFIYYIIYSMYSIYCIYSILYIIYYINYILYSYIICSVYYMLLNIQFSYNFVHTVFMPTSFYLLSDANSGLR